MKRPEWRLPWSKEKRVAKFWSKISVGKPDECWPWLKSTAGGGYGTVNWNGVFTPAHRKVWQLTNGAIPKGHYVMQTCKDRKCCNPNHLMLGKHHGSARRLERFWSYVDKHSNPNGCWEWIGSRKQNGYGKILKDYKVVMAHRYSWESVNGPIPKGLGVLHKCDNPPCVNPDHLYVGTQQQNVDDCIRRGRFNTVPKHKRKNA